MPRCQKIGLRLIKDQACRIAAVCHTGASEMPRCQKIGLGLIKQLKQTGRFRILAGKQVLW